MENLLLKHKGFYYDTEEGDVYYDINGRMGESIDSERTILLRVGHTNSRYVKDYIDENLNELKRNGDRLNGNCVLIYLENGRKLFIGSGCLYIKLI